MMIVDDVSGDDESIDNELLRNVVAKNENDIPKRRRMSVNVFKMKKAQHCLNVEEYTKNLNTSDMRLKIPKLWQSLARRTLMLSDSFRNFALSEIPSEQVIRYLYNSLSKSWSTEKAIVKMEQESFNRGAMRECFRLKKIPSFHGKSNTDHVHDWKKAENYVCKKYMEDVTRDVYFEDVRLQMDAKLWAEEFNRQAGVKKEVDIVRMSIIEFVDRPDKPIYHLEHFIEGNYIKYNSNSGFVDEHTRNTPQAFSHFTFERSGHELIVVDIQGVGDLYTDPQIHTSCKNGYGNGNLGPRGMALFFHSHKCNNVCEALVLEKFDLSQSEIKNISRSRLSSTSETVAIFQKTPFKSLRSSKPSNNLESALIEMLEEHLNEDLNDQIINKPNCSLEKIIDTKQQILLFQMSSPDSGFDIDEDICLDMADDLSNNSKDEQKNKKTRFKYDSSNSSEMKKDEESLDSYMNRNHIHRPSCAASLGMSSFKMGESILGEIHHEFANMHESGRFFDKSGLDESVDWGSVLYHEDIAASLNCMEAMLNMSYYFLGLPARDLLKSCTIKPEPDTEYKGWIYLTRAANAGHRPSIMVLADSNDIVQSKAHSRDPDWFSVIHWLERTLETMDQCDENGEFDSTNENPSYIVKARMASMLRTGGYGLDKDLERSAELYTEAADEATQDQKGRLATKYYELSEEVYGEMD